MSGSRFASNVDFCLRKIKEKAMEDKEEHLTESALDPENWERMKALGHKMLDDMMAYLQNIRSQPFNMPTEEAIKGICTPLTLEGEGEEKVYDVFLKHILPYAGINKSPRFWGFVIGTGSPYGMLAELLKGGVNSAAEGIESGGYVHRQVIDWLKEMLGYPMEAGGVLVSGGSEANFTGLAVARNTKSEVDIKSNGIQSVPRKMTLYVSEQGHESLERSVELLGFGNEALRWIPTNDEYQIRLDILKETIDGDRRRGCHPFCVIGCAGTTNSGAFDDLNALADLCVEEDLWFHIDGAFGAWVKLSDTHRHLADGIERADSIAVDLHKWMYMPYSVGCTLIKDKLAHYSTFVYGHEAKYLKAGMDNVKDPLSNPHDLALQLSRGFPSLKAYMLLRAYGKNKYSRLIQQNIDQINYLAELIDKEPEMEITAPVASNVVCFRFKPNALTEEELEKLNMMIHRDLDQISFWMISDTTIRGRYMLRVCNVNHRSQRKDFEYLVEKVKEIGARNLPQVEKST
jgi:glutamate/tyrosine decarboxylase-like PLP-dependent enzyme